MKKSSAPLNLGVLPIGKLLMQYAVPAVIAMTAASLYNITDSIFIGHGVGPLALSGLAITFPLMNLAAAFGSLVGMGGAALLSLRLGQKDYESANKILGNVLVLNIVIGILFTVLSYIFLEPMLYFFGADNDVFAYAYDFMVIILAGNVVTHIYMGLNTLLRSAGHPKKSMYATITAIIINIILNPLFIFGFGWGIRGSALATVISQSVVLVWQFKLFSDKESFIRFKKGIYKLKSEIVRGIISIGLAPFLLNAVACVVIVLVNRQLNYYGSGIAVGAYGIVNRVAFLFVMLVFGINQGMQPIAGYNYGAALYSRVTEVLKKSIILATAIMTVGFIFVELFPHAVASIFTTDEELVNLTAKGLRYTFIFFPLIGFQMVTTTFFQSIGMAVKTIFLTLTRQVLFLIPLLIILPRYFDINGVWLSMPISDFAAVFLAAALLFMQYRKFKKSSEPKKEIAQP
ncbi:MAG: MATE family efflux transporter [Endomicrobium sp.]|jgi:putative MATE family efflux protein|nr:MATE family efflux transporter [Endomicrobium sp.]